MAGPFKAYEPPPNEEGDTWSFRDAGERNGTVIVKVLKHREHVVTKNSQDAEEVRLDLVDLSDPTGKYVYRNVPAWTGSIVDGLKPYVGTNELLVLDVKMKRGASGREYPIISPAQDYSRAEKFWADRGDPFAAPPPTFSTVGTGGGSSTGSGFSGRGNNDDPPF